MKYNEIDYNVLLGHYVIPKPQKEKIKTSIEEDHKYYTGRK